MSESNEKLINMGPKYSFKYNQMVFNLYHGNKGAVLPRHEHDFPHLTVTTSGKTCVRKENVYLEMTVEDEPVNLRENEWHEIECLEDNTVFINIFEDK